MVSRKAKRKSPADGSEVFATPAKMGDLSDSQSSIEAKIAAVIEELEVEVDSRTKKILSFAEERAVEIGNAFHVQLMKLPKKIRSMPVKQFYNVHACDVDSVIFTEVKTIVDVIYARTPGDRKPNMTRNAPTPKPMPLQANIIAPSSTIKIAAGQTATQSAVAEKSIPVGKDKENPEMHEEHVEEDFTREELEYSTEGSADVSAPKTPRYRTRGAARTKPGLSKAVGTGQTSRPAPARSASARTQQKKQLSSKISSVQLVDPLIHGLLADQEALSSSNCDVRLQARNKLQNLKDTISKMLDVAVLQ